MNKTISDKILEDVFRYFKEYKNLDIEYNESWKCATRAGLEYRCNNRNIDEDEIIWQLINDDIVERYKPIIERESLMLISKFYGIDWEPKE